MSHFFLNDTKRIIRILDICLLIIFLASCAPIIRKAPANRYYLVKNSIEVKGGKFTKTEKAALIERLYGQLDDSSTIKTKDKWIFLHYVIKPPAYDSGYAGISSRNMRAIMFHLGYYNSKATFTADTSGKQVRVHYIVEPGKPTLIDTVSYKLRKDGLQQIAEGSTKQALLIKDQPITKTNVLSEISRLVDSFRNNGYYKFTAAELKVRGDTTIASLTTISDDPFEQLRLLAEAEQQKDSPKIKLAVVLNPPSDSTKLRKYYINKIYVLQDYRPGDDLSDTTALTQRATKHFILRYHEKLFRTALLTRNITFRSGDVYRQSEYYNTVTNLSKAGVWQSVNIVVNEMPDSSDKVDLIVELTPAKKFGFEAALEASYSATSNTSDALGGNLFGFSGSLSLLNRNLAKQAIKMTHTLRAGIELNNTSHGATNQLVNSNEISYSNNVSFPRLITPFRKYNNRPYLFKESFINTNFGYNNRLDLFNLQSVNLNLGWTYLDKHNIKWIFKPLTLDFNYLYNQTDSFAKVLSDNPFLRYSYNTAFVIGMGAGMSSVHHNPRLGKSLSKESSVKINVEESGLTWGLLPILTNYKRKYIKFDGEYKYTISHPKNTVVFRVFTGVGIPLGNDTTLPFFKQFFAGGSNSMRGWPVRGIGRGSQPLAPFQQSIFNDRTGDMQFEFNTEYRYDIARIIPNTLTLRGALFIDAGNIWNMRNSKPDGSTDSAQFKFKNFYKELGVSAGTGFRFDFNYLIVRFDFGFRFKRPELSYINDGWKLPSLGFDDLFKKLFARGTDDEFRKWRYENFNFTIGISYPF